MKEFNINFVPEQYEEQWEVACAKVANFLDLPEWQWLKARIHNEALPWSSIMDIVAANL